MKIQAQVTHIEPQERTIKIQVIEEVLRLQAPCIKSEVKALALATYCVASEPTPLLRPRRITVAAEENVRRFIETTTPRDKLPTAEPTEIYCLADYRRK